MTKAQLEAKALEKVASGIESVRDHYLRGDKEGARAVWKSLREFALGSGLGDITEYEEGKGPSTPWGRAQRVVRVIHGISLVDTASHGGLRVGRKKAEHVLPADVIEKSRDTAYPRNGANYLWWEEDDEIRAPLSLKPEWACVLGMCSDSVASWNNWTTSSEEAANPTPASELPNESSEPLL